MGRAPPCRQNHLVDFLSASVHLIYQRLVELAVV